VLLSRNQAEETYDKEPRQAGIRDSMAVIETQMPLNFFLIRENPCHP
jgi:hypothetical protein